MTTVLVGAEKQVYCVHHHLLRHLVPRLRVVLEKDVEETDVVEIHIPETASHTFYFIERWLCTGVFSSEQNYDIRFHPFGSVFERGFARKTVARDVDLCHVWIFGDIYGMPSMQNDAMSEILARSRDGWEHDIMAYVDIIYQGTTERSKLRFDSLYRP